MSQSRAADVDIEEELANTSRFIPLRNRREHFIPLRKSELIRILGQRLEGRSEKDRAAFEQFCPLLCSTFHHLFHERLEKLKDAYAPYNPDADTIATESVTVQELSDQVPEFFDHSIGLLKFANFHRLTREELEQAVDTASDWGVRLHVNFDVFERLEVFARGDVTGRKTRRPWWRFFKEEIVDVPVYQRLVVIFRLNDHPALDPDIDTWPIYMKLFKNIPKQDLDMLLPGTRIRMSMLDQGKILLPTLSGLILAIVKIIKGAMLLAFSGIWGLLAFLGFVGGTLGYGVKSFFGYLRTKDKYQLSLTRNLYYQNMDNNAGVLFRLFDEAEEQECREAFVAYYLLWLEAGPDGWTEEELDKRAEDLLMEMSQVDVDFEVHDALEKLVELKIARKTDAGRYAALPVRDALAQLDHSWDNVYHHPLTDPHETPPIAPPASQWEG